MIVREGNIPFKGFQTWYRLLNPEGRNTPLILLHGGPGSTHHYFRGLDSLAVETDRPVIMYDQIGCGESMVTGHPELFSLEIWMEELISLREQLDIKEAHILGQSWGGMLALWYALEGKGQGVKSYILSSTLSSASLWASEQHQRITRMATKDQMAILNATKSGDYSGAEYLAALDRFMGDYAGDPVSEISPDFLKRQRNLGTEAYQTAWGPNEFTPMGNLKGFEVTDRLSEISQPCLVMSGQQDLSSPFIAKTMADALPDAEWELFRTSRHMPFIEEADHYRTVLGKWLFRHDGNQLDQHYS